jgi:hemolysin-activating ACP:hemolysin acyltransferase
MQVAIGVSKRVGEMATEKAAVGGGDKQETVDPVAGKSVAEIFGEIVWLMSQDKDTRDLPIKDLEWLVMPPILLKQFHITYAPVPDSRVLRGEPVHKGGDDAAKSRLQPVAVELYAMCSEAVAAALDAAEPGKLSLTMQDWRSGKNRKLVRKITTFK